MSKNHVCMSSCLKIPSACLIFFCFYTIIILHKRYTYVFKRKIIIIFGLTLVSLLSHAQYDVSFSHYFDMEPSFNAASVGKQPKLNVSAAYAIDLAGFKHNPQTMYAGADMPFVFLKTTHGAGLQFMNDKIGLFTHQRLALQYAVKMKLFGGQLSTGVSAGMLSESFDGSKLDLEDSSDPAFTSSKVDGNALDLAVGLYYTHRDWYAGISAQHINSPRRDQRAEGGRHLLFDRRMQYKAEKSVSYNKAVLPCAHRRSGISWRHHHATRLYA